MDNRALSVRSLAVGKTPRGAHTPTSRSRRLVQKYGSAIRKQLRAAQVTPESESPPGSGEEKSPARNSYLTEHDAITRTIDLYIAGGRAGQGDLMRSAFHPEATIAGYCFGVEYGGSIEHLFRWINENGPRTEDRTAVRAYRDFRNYRNRTPRSAGLVGETSWAQRPHLRGLHAAETRR
jgi:hypothetical protein